LISTKKQSDRRNLSVAQFCSVFQQLLKLIPRAEFDQMVNRHAAERHARGFASWDQLVAMLFCQLGGAQSLREICDGLASMEGRMRHLGIDSPKRSTLAYANEHRPWQLFESIFQSLLGRVRGGLNLGHRFRFKNPLLSMDGSVIDLCLASFDWASYKRRKGAVKLHMLLDHAGLLPAFCVITNGKVHEINIARGLSFAPGTIVVFDRGYVDYEWFRRLTTEKVWFVTRLRESARYRVVEELPITRAHILADQIIELQKAPRYDFEPLRLRRVVVRLEDGTSMEFFTNNFRLAASTIAEIYRDRWQIESFFKTIKQNLRVKTFVGTSANAVRIQIWAALIAILILKYLQLSARRGWSMSHLIALIRMHLFSYRDLWKWLEDPFDVPTPEPSPQLALELG
jgi:DDE family transposase/uncharacterized protein DUF4372